MFTLRFFIINKDKEAKDKAKQLKKTTYTNEKCPDKKVLKCCLIIQTIKKANFHH